MAKVNKFPFPIVLTIAGLDPSGGAGILADSRTFMAFDCYPTAVITSITFQNAGGVFGSVHQKAETIRAQMLPLLHMLSVAGIKIGMLPTREIVLEVARILHEHELRSVVVDPVMRSTSGYDLIDDTAVYELCSKLLPLARLVTPNIPEAEKLVGFSVKSEADMWRAAAAIREMGVPAVLVKGGHLETPTEVVDVLDDDGQVTVFRGERIGGGEFRGTGCILSAAIAACLAKGDTLEQSVRRARDFVSGEMRTAPQMEGVGILFKPSA